MIKLSKRLQAIADIVTPNAIVADIGSDHAMLPTYLLQSGKCPSVIAGELNKGPYFAAKKQAAAAGLTEVMSVRNGNGLQVIEAGEVDTIVISGMGGNLITEILDEGFHANKLQGVTELILQPNVTEYAIRHWLDKHNWYLQDEKILEEDGKVYEILHATMKLPTAMSYAELRAELYDVAFLESTYPPEDLQLAVFKMGPYLLRKQEQLFIEKWQQEISKLDWICGQMASSDQAEAKEKLASFVREKDILEEVIRCLSMDKR